jgi:MFS family permease
MASSATPSRRPLLSDSSPLYPLSHKEFGIFWLGSLLSSLGFWIQFVGQGWQVLQLTNSALLLACVTFATTVPKMVRVLLGDIFIECFNRQKLLAWMQIVYICTSLSLGVLTTLHMIAVWQIMLVACMNGACSSVGWPAWQGFIMDLVPEPEERRGIALNSMQFNIARAIGPALGGFSISLIGIAGSYYVNALSYIAVLVPLLCLHPVLRNRVVRPQRRVWHEIQSGFQYIWRHTPLLFVLLLQLFVTLLAFPYLMLLPVFARDIFRIGLAGLGLFNAAVGIGALTGSAVIVLLCRRLERPARVLYWACGCAGLICLCFALTRNVSLATFLLILLGACTVLANTLANAAIHVMVPGRSRAQVLRIWMLILFGIAPIGNILLGWVTQVLGAQRTVFNAGATCLLVVFVLAGMNLLLKGRGVVRVA